MFDLDRFLVQHWPKVGVSGVERILACPYCPAFKSPKLWLNSTKRVFICYRCNTRGTLFRLIREKLQVSDDVVVKLLAGSEYRIAQQFDPTVLMAMILPTRDIRIVSPQEIVSRAERSLPKEYHPLPGTNVISRRIWDYLVLERSVSREQIVMHRIGYCASGRYAGCAIVPIIQDGIMVNFVARAVLRPGKRYLNAKAGTTLLDSSECIFNYDLMMMHDEITLVEGIFDCLAEGEATGALLGKRISPSQLSLLGRDRRKRIRLKLDEDVSLNESLAIARTLVDAGFVDVVAVQPYGDPNERRGVRNTVSYSLPNYLALRLSAQLPRPRAGVTEES